MTARPPLLMVGMTDNPGGKESFVLHAFRALSQDFEFWFLTDRPGIAYQDEIEAEGGHVIHVRPRGRSPWGNLQDIRAAVRSQPFQVVWSHQTVLNTLAPLRAARRAGVPVRIAHSHSSKNMGTWVAGLLHPVNKILVKRIINRRFACSDVAAEWFFGTQPYTFVPNAFDVSRFTFDPAVRAQVRSELGLRDGQTVLVHVARFGPEKNHPLVVGMVEAMRAAGDDAVVLLVGDGGTRAATEALVAEKGLREHVRFLGLRPDVARLLQAADVFVLPSFFEGLPYTVLEAQASGLPCLVSTAVTPACDDSGLVRFLDVQAPAEQWAAAAADAARGTERRVGANPLTGGQFDATTSREHLLRIIGAPAVSAPAEAGARRS